MLCNNNNSEEVVFFFSILCFPDLSVIDQFFGLFAIVIALCIGMGLTLNLSRRGITFYLNYNENRLEFLRITSVNLYSYPNDICECFY